MAPETTLGGFRQPYMLVHKPQRRPALGNSSGLSSENGFPRFLHSCGVGRRQQKWLGVPLCRGVGRRGCSGRTGGWQEQDVLILEGLRRRVEVGCSGACAEGFGQPMFAMAMGPGSGSGSNGGNSDGDEGGKGGMRGLVKGFLGKLVDAIKDARDDTVQEMDRSDIGEEGVGASSKEQSKLILQKLRSQGSEEKDPKGQLAMMLSYLYQFSAAGAARVVIAAAGKSVEDITRTKDTVLLDENVPNEAENPSPGAGPVVMNLGAMDSDAQDPGAAALEAADPDAEDPNATVLDAADQDVEDPSATVLGAAVLGAAVPDVEDPNAAVLDAADQDVEAPNPAVLGAAVPDVEDPSTAVPAVEDAKAAAPNALVPEVEDSDATETVLADAPVSSSAAKEENDPIDEDSGLTTQTKGIPSLPVVGKPVKEELLEDDPKPIPNQIQVGNWLKDMWGENISLEENIMSAENMLLEIGLGISVMELDPVGSGRYPRKLLVLKSDGNSRLSPWAAEASQNFNQSNPGGDDVRTENSEQQKNGSSSGVKDSIEDRPEKPVEFQQKSEPQKQDTTAGHLGVKEAAEKTVDKQEAQDDNPQDVNSLEGNPDHNTETRSSQPIAPKSGAQKQPEKKEKDKIPKNSEAEDADSQDVDPGKSVKKGLAVSNVRKHFPPEVEKPVNVRRPDNLGVPIDEVNLVHQRAGKARGLDSIKDFAKQSTGKIGSASKESKFSGLPFLNKDKKSEKASKSESKLMTRVEQMQSIGSIWWGRFGYGGGDDGRRPGKGWGGAGDPDESSGGGWWLQVLISLMTMTAVVFAVLKAVFKPKERGNVSG